VSSKGLMGQLDLEAWFDIFQRGMWSLLYSDPNSYLGTGPKSSRHFTQ
jgi:hypothetical protein